MYILGFHVLVLAAWLATLGVSVFAFWKGDPPARLAALAYLAVEISPYIINPSVGNIGSESILLIIDFVCAVTFLLLAVRYASLWLGAAMIFQAAQFSLHAYYLVMALPHDKPP